MKNRLGLEVFTMRRNSKSCYVIGIVFQMIVLILELLPLGAVLIFAPGPGETMKETFSYFDLTVMGYANFAPIVTGILTVAAMLFGIITLFRFDKAKLCKTAAVICSVIAVLSSLAPLLFFGHEYMTLTSYVISVMMAVSIYFQVVADRKK